MYIVQDVHCTGCTLYRHSLKISEIQLNLFAFNVCISDQKMHSSNLVSFLHTKNVEHFETPVKILGSVQKGVEKNFLIFVLEFDQANKQTWY